MIRRYNSFLVIIFLFFSVSLTIGQSIIGTVIDDKSNAPIIGAIITLDNTEYEAVTNAKGVFRLYDVPVGDYNMSINYDENIVNYGAVSVGDNTTDLGNVPYDANVESSYKSEIGIITLDDNDLQDDNSTSGIGVSSLLTASRDPFVSAAAFNLSVGRFRQRGYGNEDQWMYLNGMAVNDLDDGRVGWATWGGLNDVLRVGSLTNDLDASQTSFGGMLGSRNIDLSASVQRKQTKLVFNRNNRSYQNRLMLTHSSGEQSNGWAYTVSLSRRWGNSGYTPGTFYDSYSYALLVDKRLNEKHLLNLAVLGSPTKRGRNGVSIQEVYDLVGSNYYNPNWGYQNGKVRNSRVSDYHQPYFILRHDWDVSSKLTIRNTAAYHTGYFGNSRLDWFDAPDPRPDYYRKLPSFQEFESVRNDLTEYFQNNPDALQVNFDKMININKNSLRTFENVNGTDEALTGLFSRYIIEAQHFDNEKISLGSVLNWFISDAHTMTTGVSYLKETNNQYRKIVDMLGGEYYIDLDRFAERDFPDDPSFAQNDLQNPNRILTEGDIFGWNFDIVTDRKEFWTQNAFTFDKLDVFASLRLSQTSFFRNGYYQNGRFPDNSLGKGDVYNFFNYAAKLGGTYKIDGRNYIYARGSYRTRAPFSRNVFLSPRTRDEVSPVLKNETIYGGEVGYTFRYPGVKGRVTAFYTEFKDQLQSRNIYFEATNSFGNYLLTGIDRKHQGIELGAEIKINSTLTANVAGSVGAYQYNSRPRSLFTADNEALNPDIIAADDSEIFIKNYYLPGVQNAGSIGLEYRSPKFWFINVNGNFFNNINIDLFPERRTNAAVEGIVLPDNQELSSSIIDQTELSDQFALNLFAGKSWRVKKTTIQFSISVNNILNNKEFVTGGFEQFRYRDRQPEVFPERLFYAWGTNYSAGITLRY